MKHSTEILFGKEMKISVALASSSLSLTLSVPFLSYVLQGREHAGTWHHVKCAQVMQACCGRRRKGGWCLHMLGRQTCVTCLLCLLRAEPLSRAVPTHATHSSSFLFSLCNQLASRPPSSQPYTTLVQGLCHLTLVHVKPLLTITAAF